MFHHPAWAVGSYSSGHQPGELPKSKSTQPSRRPPESPCRHAIARSGWTTDALKGHPDANWQAKPLLRSCTINVSPFLIHHFSLSLISHRSPLSLPRCPVPTHSALNGGLPTYLTDSFGRLPFLPGVDTEFSGLERQGAKSF